MSARSLDPFGQCGRRKVLAGLNEVLHLSEEPRMTDRGAAHHNAVHSVAFLHGHGLFRTVHIAVPKNGNVHSRVVLHFTDQGPVRFALVHLLPRSAVDAQSLNTHILKALSHIDDEFGLFVPAQSGLYSDRQ